MSPPLPLEFSAVTHPGLERENNEDCFLSLPEKGLWLIADGMGGHEAGEVASAIVRDTVNATFIGKTALDETIQASHRAVLDAAARGYGAPGMGSTVVALRSDQRQYEIAWVGDSRAYLWTHTPDGGRLERLTCDHSYVQMLYKTGAITADEIDQHPARNIITQCLGSAELDEVQVDVVQGQWQKDQWILLCSDGLSDEVDDDTIAELLFQSSDCDVAVDQLLHAALTNGGHDNVTLQIIESPLQHQRKLSLFWQWIPYLTGHRQWDAMIYSTALISLLALLYTIVK
jgi:serine/threonine protein phosphatase PrpC